MKTRQLGNSIRQIAYGNEIMNTQPFKYKDGELVKVWRRINKYRWGAARDEFAAGDMGIIVGRKTGMPRPVYTVFIQRLGKEALIFEDELNYKFTKKMRRDLNKND